MVEEGSLRPGREKFSLILPFVDYALIYLLLWVSVFLRDAEVSELYQTTGLLSAAWFVLLAELSGLYKSWRQVELWSEILKICLAWLCVIPMPLILAFVSKTTTNYSRFALLLWFISSPVILSLWHSGWRMLLQLLHTQGWNLRNAAIFGVNKVGLRVCENIIDLPWMGLSMVGFYDDRPAERLPEIPFEKIGLLGNIDALIQSIKDGRIDQVYVSLPMNGERRIRDVIDQLSDTTASVFVVPDFFLFNLMHVRWTSVGDIPSISVYATPFYGADGIIKRIEDIILSIFILTLVSIPMVIIAILIKLTSRGPIIFRQRRYGLGGELIEVWKFRSMTVCQDGENIPQATKDDVRITRLGAFLRRTSMDELPQFINVLQGRMSIVGPRPHAVAHNEHYRQIIKGYMMRHKVRPGITGWAQINGWRGETKTVEKMRKRVEFDMYYIRNWSLILDLKIICKTIPTAIFGRDAY